MGWYRFGNFELDVNAFVLRRGSQVLPLQPKVFDVLRCLVERRGALVTKAELLHELWNDEDVNENVIAWCISHIRRALGQQRGARSPIETIAGRGYRFTAELTSGDGAEVDRGAHVVEPRRASPLVGRGRVMSELQEHVQDTAAGRGSLCVITGEAGIGKTRCVQEVAATAASFGVKMLFGRCSQEATAPPLWPIAVALRGLSQAHPELALRARRLISGFGDGDDPPVLAQPTGGRFWWIDQVARLLRDLAATEPTLLILDDLQWADASTLDLLALLAPELREIPLFIVATLRDGELQSGSLRDQPLRRVLRYAKTIPLGALEAADVAELTWVIGKHRPSPELAEAVRRAAGGVPLFVEEIVHSLVLEHGAQALEGLPASAVHVPRLARDLLRERILRLPQATTKLLSTAAVIGDSFDLSLLLAAVELEPDNLLDGLEPALLEGQVKSDAPHTYSFVHSLFQSVLYDEVPMAERVALHRKLGTLLLARPKDERQQAEVARHFYLSLPVGDHRVVMEHARSAGDAAQRVYAFEDAVVYYTWALEAQGFGAAAEPRTRGGLLLSLAAAQRAAGRTHDALETTARLIELAQQHRMHDLVVQAARLRRPTVAMSMVPDALARSALELLLEQLPDEASTTRVSALSQLAYIPPYTSDLSRSKALSARAEVLAGELPTKEPRLEAMRARLFSLSGPDDVEQVLQLADRMLEIEAGVRTWYTGDALGARFAAYILTGRIAEADVVLDQMKAGISQRHWPEATFFCERLAAQRRFLDGELDEAERLYKALHAQAVRAGVSYGDMFYATFTVTLALEREGAKAVAARGPLAGGPLANMTSSMRANVARVAAESGQHDVARKQLSSLGDPSDYPRDGHYLNLLANLSVCASHVDDKTRCEQLLALLSPYASFNTPSQMGYYLGSVSYFLGLLSQAIGRSVAAGAHFERALVLNRSMGYRAGVVRTLLAHGQLSLRLGHRSQARDLLTRARDEAQALGMRGAVEDAVSALARA